MSWKARLLMGLMLVAMLMAIAGPAMADHTQRHENRIDNRQDRIDERQDRFDNDFFFIEEDFDDEEFDEFFFPFFAEVDVDVDEENVGPRNDNEGECIVTEVDWDLDGFIADWEIDVTCFV